MLASRQWAPDEMELQDAPQLAAAAPPWRFPPAARNIHFDEAAKLVTGEPRSLVPRPKRATAPPAFLFPGVPCILSAAVSAVWDPESSRVDVYGPHADPLAQAVPSTLPERPLSLSHASGTSSPALSSGSSPPWVSRADSLSEKTGRLRVVSAASGAAERRSLGASPQDPPSPASKSVRQSMDRSARIRAYHLSKSYGSGLTARSSLDGPPSPPTPIFSLVIPDPHGSGTSDAPAVGAPAAGESSAGTRNASASSGTRGASGDVSVRISRGHSLVAMWSRGDREVNVVVRGEGSRAKARIYLPAASSERSPQGGGVWGVFWGSGGDVCVASAHGLVGYRRVGGARTSAACVAARCPGRRIARVNAGCPGHRIALGDAGRRGRMDT